MLYELLRDKQLNYELHRCCIGTRASISDVQAFRLATHAAAERDSIPITQVQLSLPDLQYLDETRKRADA